MSEETLFAAALDEDNPAARSAFLDRACGGDVALRQRVEALLRAHDSADSLLDAPPDLIGSVDDQGTGPITEMSRPGDGLDEEKIETSALDQLSGAVTTTRPEARDATHPGPSRPMLEGPGTRIGPYKLLQKIGEGGWASSTWPSRNRPSVARSP